MWITIVLAVLLCLSACYNICQKRKTYRMIDRLLDSVLSREMIVYSDVEEGEYSALISKVKQIQEVLGSHVQGAEKEKEQVKSLVSNMSHQLKTPLANLSLYAEILGKEELAPDRRARFACKLKRQVEKLGWITESLAKMVKLEQNIDGFEVKDTKIRQTILDAVDTVYEKLENKKIRLIMEPFEDIQLYHNRKWTAEVFVNLLENAVKYTREGGSVSIGIKTYEIYTEIRIADNGRGIRQEELTDIFKRFYRSREAEDIEGSGIGLYLSGLILEKEKGYMTVVSEYGEGSCFSVFLQNCKNCSSVCKENARYGSYTNV
ncbi:MAG: HAMP domain-containing histidine kinase [Dorea sp.]|nr:HAMP domain-containing histidine kinase [Dorea sp.]